MSQRARVRHAAGQRRPSPIIEDGPEADFQAQILELAKYCGWSLQYHTFDSRRSAPGFPDVVLVRGARLLFIEVKTAKGRVTPEQQAWWLALTTVSQAVQEASEALEDVDPSLSAPTPVTDRHGPPAVGAYIWRPADWAEIEEVLR